jgi:hypothetical protein
MRLVMTLRTRDNEDIVGAQLAFHLNAGVDFVIVTDQLSADGTREILREHERAGHLRLICKDVEHHVPGKWVNDMAELAATEHDADWVIHADVDEFWWPRGGNLKDVLGSVPARFGALFGVWRHFAPRPEDGSYFTERMTLRLTAHGPWTAPEHPFHPNVNVAHRADPNVRIRIGNHDIDVGPPLLRGWFPIEVLHFPLRSRAQAAGKYEKWSRTAHIDHGPHVDAAVASLDTGGFHDHYGQYVVHDDALAAGIREGLFSVDVRLRDALRLLAGDATAPLPEHHRFPLATPGSSPLRFPSLEVADAAALADDVAILPEPGRRVELRVAQLERRLAERERTLGSRVRSRLAASRAGRRSADR